MSARAGVALLATLAATAVGCTHAGASAPADGGHASNDAADAVTCSALGSLVDLRRSIMSSPTSSGTPLFALVDTEEELAYARAALEHLSVSRAPSAMQASVKGLASILESRTGELRRATADARDSYAAAESNLRSAATCRGIDLRELSKHQEKTEDVAIARSKACDGPLRLWAATKSAELSSDISTAAVAGQLGELRLDKESTVRRDRLATALGTHAKRLGQLKALAGSPDPTANQQALLDARRNVGEQIENAFRGCLGSGMTASADSVSKRGAVDARSATVMVKPTWSGALKALGAGERRFGSGFIVRWKKRDGKSETLVVTNRHVMEGALEAEILLSSEIDTHDRRGAREAPRTARLVAADETDDIAVLRVDGGAAPLSALGLAFRADPPREQEVVVAAGFPGVGMMPSFQVTKGVVSNAHFGSEERDVGIAYLQHTAAIDPGNSGGPLLDEAGRLVGMNTAKLNGRDNVSLAIPAARIRFALRRAEERRTLDVAHAAASCNIVLEALAAEHPTMASVDRFGLALFESVESRSDGTRHHRDRVVGEPDGPIEDARLRAFEAVREEMEQAGGVLPFEACKDVTRSASVPGAPASFTARFQTRTGIAFRASLVEESEVVRLVGVDRAQ